MRSQISSGSEPTSWRGTRSGTALPLWHTSGLNNDNRLSGHSCFGIALTQTEVWKKIKLLLRSGGFCKSRKTRCTQRICRPCIVRGAVEIAIRGPIVRHRYVLALCVVIDYIRDCYVSLPFAGAGRSSEHLTIQHERRKQITK